jgi:hypothetical protein
MKVILILFFLSFSLIFADQRMLLGYFNDNITGDDFLSYGGIAWYQKDQNYILASGVALTSSRLKWRYDLGQIQIHQENESDMGRFNYGLDLLLKAPLIGQQLQNFLHSNTGVAEMHLKYDPTEIGAGVSIAHSLRSSSILNLGIYNKLSLNTSILPHHTYSILSGELDWWRWHGTGLIGWRQTLNSIYHFSEVDRSGPLICGISQVRIWDKFNLQVSIMYRSVQPNSYENEGGWAAINGFMSTTTLNLVWDPHFEDWMKLVTQW